MAIPKELSDPIDEIKTPSNKVLVLVLIMAVMALFGFIVYKDRKADSPSSELEYERSQKLYERWEKERLQKRLEECELEKYTTAMQRLKVQDSAKKILNIK